jgi:protein-histidine pros-kinase
VKRWLRDTLFLRLFLLMWATLVVSHIAAFGFVTSGVLPGQHRPPGRGAAELPTFPSLPPTPGLPGEARRVPPAEPGATAHTVAPALRPEPPRLPTHLLVIDSAVRLLVIGAAAALGARWLTAPVRRLVQASDALARSLPGNDALPTLDERAGTAEVREAARVFNGMARELDAQFRSRGLLMASLSHDLKTPLTRIRMRLESLRPADDALVQRSIADIHEANALLDLALGAFGSGVDDEPVHTVDVAALLQSMVDDRIEQGQQLAFTAEGLALASARPLALRRVFDNLLNNAIRYGERADIRVEPDRERVRVRIDDAGPGIDAMLFDSVFQPFYRVESSRNRSTGGIGLGLYIARDQLRRQGGDVVLSNLRTGLRAEVTLPRASDE